MKDQPEPNFILSPMTLSRAWKMNILKSILSYPYTRHLQPIMNIKFTYPLFSDFNYVITISDELISHLFQESTIILRAQTYKPMILIG